MPAAKERGFRSIARMRELTLEHCFVEHLKRALPASVPGERLRSGFEAAGESSDVALEEATRIACSL
jgi:hypothetical protein